MQMTRKIAAGCFAAMFGLAVSAGAQTPSTPQTPSPSPATPSSPSQPPASPTSPYPSSQSADRGAKESKITGCIAAGASASSFELTNVKKGMADSAASAAAAPADAASKNVKLTAASGVDLAAHVGHTVEVTGSWAKSEGPSSAAPSASSPSASAPGASGMAKEFTVKNVKMVSSTCSAGTN
jgi:hypothetical protein